MSIIDLRSARAKLWNSRGDLASTNSSAKVPSSLALAVTEVPRRAWTLRAKLRKSSQQIHTLRQLSREALTWAWLLLRRDFRVWKAKAQLPTISKLLHTWAICCRTKSFPTRLEVVIALPAKDRISRWTWRICGALASLWVSGASSGHSRLETNLEFQKSFTKSIKHKG